MIREIWKLNVSTLILLSLYNKVSNNLLYKKANISFTQLCFLYKLKTCYVDVKFKNLLLVFPKDFTSSKLINTNLNNISLNEYIISLSEYNKFEIYNDYIIFYLKLELQDQDIKQLILSNYSKLSNNFRNRIDYSLNYKYVYNTNDLGHFITTNNITRSICAKENYMKELIEKELKIKLPKEGEYFHKFGEKDEFLNINKL